MSNIISFLSNLYNKMSNIISFLSNLYNKMSNIISFMSNILSFMSSILCNLFGETINLFSATSGQNWIEYDRKSSITHLSFETIRSSNEERYNEISSLVGCGVGMSNIQVIRICRENHGVIQRMSVKCNCLDNAVMENSFGILKSEIFYLKKFKSFEEFEKKLKMYIDYYNNARIKSKLNRLSPVKFRTQSYF